MARHQGCCVSSEHFLGLDRGTTKDLLIAPRQTRPLYARSTSVWKAECSCLARIPHSPRIGRRLAPVAERYWRCLVESVNVEEPPFRMNFRLPDYQASGHFSSSHHPGRLRAGDCFTGVSTAGLPMVKPVMSHIAVPTEEGVADLLMRLAPQRPLVLHELHPSRRRRLRIVFQSVQSGCREHKWS